MYGVRGANGVIVITTKHGQIGAPQVRVHVEHSINQPTKFPDFLVCTGLYDVTQPTGCTGWSDITF